MAARKGKLTIRLHQQKKSVFYQILGQIPSQIKSPILGTLCNQDRSKIKNGLTKGNKIDQITGNKIQWEKNWNKLDLPSYGKRKPQNVCNSRLQAPG